MALANYALPDGDPRKSTHEKVQLLTDLTSHMWQGHRSAEQRDALLTLSRRLNALLLPTE